MKLLCVLFTSMLAFSGLTTATASVSTDASLQHPHHSHPIAPPQSPPQPLTSPDLCVSHLLVVTPNCDEVSIVCQPPPHLPSSSTASHSTHKRKVERHHEAIGLCSVLSHPVIKMVQEWADTQPLDIVVDDCQTNTYIVQPTHKEQQSWVFAVDCRIPIVDNGGMSELVEPVPMGSHEVLWFRLYDQQMCRHHHWPNRNKHQHHPFVYNQTMATVSSKELMESLNQWMGKAAHTHKLRNVFCEVSDSFSISFLFILVICIARFLV